VRKRPGRGRAARAGRGQAAGAGSGSWMAEELAECQLRFLATTDTDHHKFQ